VNRESSIGNRNKYSAGADLGIAAVKPNFSVKRAAMGAFSALSLLELVGVAAVTDVAELLRLLGSSSHCDSTAPMMAKCDENNLFVCKNQSTGELMVVEVAHREEDPPFGGNLYGHLLVMPSPDRSGTNNRYKSNLSSKIVPLASLVPFDEETYHRIAIILEEDAAASGYEPEERRRLWEFHEHARLALYTLAAMGPDYEEGCQRIEEFRKERLRLHPDVFEPEDEDRCSFCRANPCYYNCINVLSDLAWM
jgi:hypothetical protein